MMYIHFIVSHDYVNDVGYIYSNGYSDPQL